MTGLEFIENQKTKNCKIQNVVLISGGWTEETVGRAHELGCKTFSKPFPFDEFFIWLDEIEKRKNYSAMALNKFGIRFHS